MEKEELYIFLDVDGVLNRARDWERMLFPLNLECIRWFGETVKALREQYEVHLILSSSWRDGFQLRGTHSRQVAELVQKLAFFAIEIEGKTPFDLDGNRAEEINSYLGRNHLEGKRAIVLDDAQGLFQSPLPERVTLHLVNPGTGFCKEDFEQLTNRRRGFRAVWEWIKHHFLGTAL